MPKRARRAGKLLIFFGYVIEYSCLKCLCIFALFPFALFVTGSQKALQENKVKIYYV